MDNATRSKMLNEAVDLLNRADALLQKAMGAGEECYAIHSAIECAADDIVDVIVACDDGTFEEVYQ